LGDYAGADVSTSANRFAQGSNQNQGNWMTDRSTTRLHQAPGGNSSINLGDAGPCPDNVGVTLSKRFEGQSIKVNQAPGGASSMCLGAGKNENCVQDENVNNANVQQIISDTVVKPVVRQTQAPGGNSSVVLG